MKDLKYLNKYLLRYKYTIFAGIVFVILNTLFGIIPAQLVRDAFDSINESISIYYLFDNFSARDNLYELFSFLLIVFAISIITMALTKGFFMFFMRQTIILVSRYIEYDLKNDIYYHYQTLPMSFYSQNNTGDLMARISEDVSRVRMYLGPAIMYTINLLITFILVIGNMIIINVELTLYVLLPLPLLSLSIYLVSKVINKQSERIQYSLSRMTTFIQEIFSGIHIIKAHGREKYSYSSFETENENYKRHSLNLSKTNAFFFPVVILLIGLSSILTVFVGGLQVIKGSITPGNIAEFVIYVNMLTWPVTSLGWITSIVQRAAASQKRINNFLNVKNTIVSTKNHYRDIEGDISFNNVVFTYPNSTIKALNNLTFKVEKGNTIAILGSIGSGKTTIAHLICRMYDPTHGTILIDGKDIKSWNVQEWRNQIGYVSQDIFLFSDTIRNNITFSFDGAIDDERIWKSIKASGLYDTVMSFPKGIDTFVGERGIMLSGGQKQRVAIARAIIKNPKLFILDDSLSAVDTKTERFIIDSLAKIMHARTSIIISHRVSVAQLADDIIVLDKGHIIGKGNHKELLRNNEYYSHLYNKQLVNENLLEKDNTNH